MAAGDGATQRKASSPSSPAAMLSAPSKRLPSTSPVPKLASPLASAAGSGSLPRTSADEVWTKWEQEGAIQAGLLPRSGLDAFLADMRLSASHPLKASLMEDMEGQGSGGLTLEQINALCSSMGSMSPPRASSSQSSEGQAASAPLKKCLSKSRAYLGTGYLVYDETVVTYIRKLEEHRKKCEADGRYKEAKAAASRLVDLKTAQVARMRQELMLVQTQELSEVHQVYEEETHKFTAVWEARVKDYQTTFVRTVEEMRSLHQQQGEQYTAELLAKRPTKPQPSRDYLNNKKIEASLAKAKEYKRASQVKSVTEEMYQQELHQAQQGFEAEYRLRVAKLVAKQRTEMEALMQRGVRGKSELELRRATETERRMFRFRNIVMELESLHKLEVVSLENFLDGQVLAGKATPLEDGFRRKREQLFSIQF